MKNKWTEDLIVPKGSPFWTFQTYDDSQKPMNDERVAHIDERPTLNVIENLKVVNGEDVWTPACVVWDDLAMRFNDSTAADSFRHGDDGILRCYDGHGAHCESWVLKNLKIVEVISFADATTVLLTFKEVRYIYEKQNHG